jgi:hypothetical protein
MNCAARHIRFSGLMAAIVLFTVLLLGGGAGAQVPMDRNPDEPRPPLLSKSQRDILAPLLRFSTVSLTPMRGDLAYAVAGRLNEEVVARFREGFGSIPAGYTPTKPNSDLSLHGRVAGTLITEPTPDQTLVAFLLRCEMGNQYRNAVNLRSIALVRPSVLIPAVRQVMEQHFAVLGRTYRRAVAIPDPADGIIPAEAKPVTR